MDVIEVELYIDSADRVLVEVTGLLQHHSLEPGRTSTSAQARPAGGRQNFFTNNNRHHHFPRFFFWPARGGGRQAPRPPRERGQSVVNNYDHNCFRSPFNSRALLMRRPFRFTQCGIPPN